MDTTEDGATRGVSSTEEDTVQLPEHFFMVVVMDPENLAEWRRTLLLAKRSDGPKILDLGRNVKDE